jgi:hypothetical protein
MQIVFREPPLFDLIDEQFHVKGKDVIYAWGDQIFNPAHIKIGPELLAHEAVHGARQMAFGGPIVWWRRYLIDPEFRLQEELPAHRAELEILLEMAKNRNERRYWAKAIAKKLSSPMYGRMTTTAKAVRLLNNGGAV